MPDSRTAMQVSIRTRIIALVILLTALALAVSGFTLYVLQRANTLTRVDDYLLKVEEELKILAQDGVDPVTGEQFTGPSEVLRTYLERNVLAANEGQVAVVAGKIRWTAAEGVALRPEDDAEMMRQLVPLADLDRVSRGQIQTASGRYVYLVVPLHFTSLGDSSEARGALIHVHDLDVEQALIDQTVRQYAIVASGALALVSVLVWLVVGRLLRPIEWLRRTTQSIGEDDLTTRIPVQSRDDLGGLTTSINGMLDRVQHSFESQRTLLDDVGHELRTPITIVRGHLELLDPHDPDDVTATRDLALDELQRMGNLVNDLLLLATSSRPDFIQPGWVDVATLLDSTFEKARALGPRTWRISAMASGECWLDETRITQAWLQLAANAVKYSQPETTIALGTRVTRGELHLWVTDQGIGIAEEDLVRVRERFGRSRAAANRADGAGLGLSIVETIVSGHHGRLQIDSQPGSGSTFTIVLPITAGEGTEVDGYRGGHRVAASAPAGEDEEGSP
ncbi:HAMP domain-containing histidine kinase [Tessaracoccus sp. SD287]|uniref:sensor histidine kinase n=1 Tax=Tessaracoccus sp. SD287 TaxID=2782008 RepID=UPI001A95AA86|nr:HAMP domain-containing sensor histidine kinase [Tessaracoccus sp. SD287]MBO1030700.1 HAMP domain-containing histidine kinase [Tessaracoccus sp. SD287]